LCPVGELELRKQLLMTAISVFGYSSWLSLLVFVPIAFQFSGGDGGGKLLRCLTGPAVVGIGLLSVVFTGMCVNWVGVRPIEVLQQPICCPSIFLLYDVPSFVVVLATITALRLGMGRLQNRYNWIPICIIIGVLWTFQGVTMILSDLNPETFYVGFQVSLITTVYACICAAAVLVNRAWFFTAIWGILATYFFVVEGAPNTPILVIPLLIALCCGIGRFCDMLYLSVTRYESFSGLFRKHIIDWIVCGVLAVLLMLLVFIAFLVRVLVL